VSSGHPSNPSGCGEYCGAYRVEFVRVVSTAHAGLSRFHGTAQDVDAAPVGHVDQRVDARTVLEPVVDEDFVVGSRVEGDGHADLNGTSVAVRTRQVVAGSAGEFIAGI